MNGVQSDKAGKIVEKFKKIMGPVAETLAKEAVASSGGKMDGAKIALKDDAQLKKFKAAMAEKCGKIIGTKLAEAIIGAD